MVIKHSNEKNQDDKIGIALSHYHHKLGPMFVGISFDFTTFDRITQYNILQDSISSRTEDLALFTHTKDDKDYTIRIKKIKILDPLARGGVQRYAVVLIIPSYILKFEFQIEDIAQDIVDKLSQGANIHQSLKAWSTLLNDIHGSTKPIEEEELEIIRSIKPKTHTLDLF